MAAVVTAQLGGQPSYSASLASAAGDYGANPQTPTSEEQYIATFFCRALYDYQAQDASSLSFRKGDIIEVLTQLETGWWDGLLGEERGWFPSNYVVIISDQEAEAALSAPELHLQSQASGTDDSMVDLAHSLTRGNPLSDTDWLNGDGDYPSSRNGAQDMAAASAGRTGGTSQSDFWVPQVSSDGQIYYVNTQTGQRARDLPSEADGDFSDSDLSRLTPQSNSRSARSGSSAGELRTAGAARLNSQDAGFGLPRRSGTPEPWVRKLADDGMSYYYLNTQDGTRQWTRPTEDQGSRDDGFARDRAYTTPNPNRRNNRDTIVLPSTSGIEPSVRQARDRSHSINNIAEHSSVASDDSSVQPLDDRSISSRAQSSPNDRSIATGEQSPEDARSQEQSELSDLTSAERLARSLQQMLAPVPPDSLTELSTVAREAISRVMECVQVTDPIRLALPGQGLDERVLSVVVAIRNLLYVAAPGGSHVPSSALPRGAQDYRSNPAAQNLQQHLKPAQRKVTATLSKLVLSARAMQYDAGASTSDAPTRMEVDAAELERAVVAFTLEVQRYHSQNAGQDQVPQLPMKRLYGVFSPTNVGLGLVGAGAAGCWKGFGWILVDRDHPAPSRVLGPDVISEFQGLQLKVEEKLARLSGVLRVIVPMTVMRASNEGQAIVGHLHELLEFVSDVYIMRHVDIDGFQRDVAQSSNGDLYMQTVSKARVLVRTLEASMQALFDDGASLLFKAQALRPSEPETSAECYRVEAFAGAIKANMGVVQQTLEALLSVGHDQADMSQGDYMGNIDWRMSRLSVIDSDFMSDLHPMAESIMEEREESGDDIVDAEIAFSKPRTRMQPAVSVSNGSPASSLLQRSGSQSQWSETTMDMSDASRSTTNGDGPATPTWSSADNPALAAASSLRLEADAAFDDDPDAFFDEEVRVPTRSRKGAKLMKIFGDDAPQHYVDNINADSKPWYLRPSYNQNEIMIEPDGEVRAGTISALVEKLTNHEQSTPNFVKTFLMTYKSFTSLNELFDLLVKRFWIQQPDGLNPRERDEWIKMKQNVIRIRVLNIFKAMVTDEDILDREDMYILDRIKAFVSNEQVIQSSAAPAAKQLLIHIENYQRGGDAMIKMTLNTPGQMPPPPIVPKTSKKLKLLDIDPLEIARQLTILESQLFLKIKAMECLQRSQKSGEHNDSISAFIQTFNRIANWVKESILAKEDSRKRAAIIKQFINAADRCRTLHNFSSMAAIVSGLNASPISRLKRTWDQVGSKATTQLNACHIDTSKNYQAYRSTLSKTTPPCVPFFGIYLTDLVFIGDGNKDNLPGNLVNFRKRHRVAEIIQEIKRWQSKPYNFHPVAPVLAYIEEALNQFNEQVDYDDHFYNLSLEREPREREDEKMARLLQESGFL